MVHNPTEAQQSNDEKKRQQQDSREQPLLAFCHVFLSGRRLAESLRAIFLRFEKNSLRLGMRTSKPFVRSIGSRFGFVIDGA